MSQVHPCPHCPSTFSQADHRDLHIGRVHPEAMTGTEQARFEAAEAREAAWITGFQGHAKGGLATLPILGLYLFLVVGTAVVMDLGNPGFVFLPLPFTLALSAFVYYMAYKGHEHEQERAA